MSNYVSSHTDTKDVVRMLKAMDEAYMKAGARTLNEAGRKYTRGAIREISAVENIKPMRLIRKRFRRSRAHASRLQVVIKCLAHPLPAIKLAGVTTESESEGADNSGVSAGGHFWPGAFVKRQRRFKPFGYFVFTRRTDSTLKGVKIDISESVDNAMWRLGVLAVKFMAKRLPENIIKQLDRERFGGSR